MKTVRSIVRSLFNVIGGVLILLGVMMTGFAAIENHSFSFGHFLEIVIGFILIFAGELIAGKRASKSN